MTLKVKNILVFILFINSIIALYIFHFPNEYSLNIILFLALISSFCSLVVNKNNFVFQFRSIIIIWVGLIPCLAIYSGGYFASRMVYVQTDEIGLIFGILVCTTLFSSQIGFLISENKKYVSIPMDFAYGNKVFFLVVAILILIAGYLIALRRGDFVFTSGTNDLTKIKMPVQNLQAVVAILFCMLTIFFVRLNNFDLKKKNLYSNFNFYILLFLLLYVTLWSQFLRGSRMDAISIFILLYVLYYSTKGKIVVMTLKYFLIAIFLIFVFHFWGAARNLLPNYSIKEIIDLVYFNEQIIINGKPILLFSGSISNISVGVAGMIYAVQNELVELWYGKSYLDFFARIPPAIIYPNRPESLAWFSVWIYQDSSGGGVNEMGEIYLNFGIYGSLFVPAVISYLIGWSYNRHLYNPLNLWLSLPFIAILSVYLRFLLYQNFDGFKSWITALIIYLTLNLFYRLLVNSQKKI